jgi:4-diphosphocytidyl-2-C-methyl-D-erythritol kinase
MNSNFHQQEYAIPGDASNNLCIKAYQLLKKDFSELPSIKMHLHKHIPMGAGIGWR